MNPEDNTLKDLKEFYQREDVKQFFKEQGRRGGLTSLRVMHKNARIARAKRAVEVRESRRKLRKKWATQNHKLYRS